MEHLCPAGVLVSSEPRICQCRIADALVDEREDKWSLLNLCEGEYTACQTWKDEKDTQRMFGRGALAQMERMDAPRRAEGERVRALSARIAEADEKQRQEW